MLLVAMLTLLQNDPADRESLLKQAGRLRVLSQDRSRAAECLELLKTLTPQPGEDEFGQISASLFMAWERLGRIARGTKPDAELAKSLEEFTAKSRILDRLAKQGGAAALSGLIRLSRSKDRDGNPAPYSKEAEQAIRSAASEPVKQYPGSQLSLIVAATVEAGDLVQGRRYLANAAWHSEAAEDAQAPARRIQSVIEWRIKADEKQFEMAKVVAAFDENDALVARLLLDIGVLAARHTPTSELFGPTARMPRSAEYWHQVILRYLSEEDRDLYVPVLAKYYALTFGRSASEFLLKLAELQDGAFKKLEALSGALEAASEDAARVEILKRIAAQYSDLREFSKGQDAVREGKKLVKDAGLQGEVERIAQDLALKQQADDERVRRENAQAVQERLDAEVRYLEERLEQARKDQPEEIVSRLEAELKQAIENAKTQTPTLGVPAAAHNSDGGRGAQGPTLPPPTGDSSTQIPSDKQEKKE